MSDALSDVWAENIARNQFIDAVDLIAERIYRHNHMFENKTLRYSDALADVVYLLRLKIEELEHE